MPTPELPDPSVVLREALLAQAAITGGPAQTRIRRRLDANPAYPMIMLREIDTVSLRPEANACRVQADVLGAGETLDDEDEAKDIARALQSVARDCDGDWASGKIRNCEAPNRLPSPETSGRARIIVDFTLEIYQ